MTDQEAAAKIEAIVKELSPDWEGVSSRSDVVLIDALLSLGYTKTVDAYYEAMKKASYWP